MPELPILGRPGERERDRELLGRAVAWHVHDCEGWARRNGLTAADIAPYERCGFRPTHLDKADGTYDAKWPTYGYGPVRPPTPTTPPGVVSVVVAIGGGPTLPPTDVAP